MIRKEPTKVCCATCAARPAGAERFICPVIDLERSRILESGCVQWKEAKA